MRRVADLHAELAEAHKNLAVQLASLAPVEPSLADAPAMPPTPDRPLLDAHAVAARLGVDVRTVRRWRSEGKLPPAVTLSGVIRWRPEVVDAWLAEREGAA